MKKIFTIMMLSIVFSGELEIEGDLKVTGNIQNQTIDSLQQVIAQQQQRISTLEILMNYLIQNFDIPYDCNGAYGGTAISDINGECCEQSVIDACSVCNGDNSTCNTVTDIDGNVYATVQIGSQNWFKQNLKVTHYNNGSEISTGYSDEDWVYVDIGSYAIYNDDPFNKEIYGNLYNWYALADERGVCPVGWHVPTDEEWGQLIQYLDENNNYAPEYIGIISHTAGADLKEQGITHWFEPNTDATNESGFTALPGGARNGYNGSGYWQMGDGGNFWSITEYPPNTSEAYFYELTYSNSTVHQYARGKSYGQSVRCVQD